MQPLPLQSLSLHLRTSLACEKNSHLELTGFHDLIFLGLFTDTLTGKRASNFLSLLQVIEIMVHFNHVAHLSTCGSSMLFQFFTILRERCDTDKLGVLTLNGISGKVRSGPDVFMPLQACRNLTRLSVERGCDISISDEELYQLVRAWPKLEVLKISCYNPFHNTIMPTLHGLIELLWLCPNLTSLALVIDAIKLDGINLKSPGGGRCNKFLKHLVLGNSPVGTPLKVALTLSGLFPNLEQVDFDCWDTNKSFVERQKSELVNSILDGVSVLKQRCTEATLSSDCDNCWL